MKDTTFIIHFRQDCDDRVFNLKTVLKYLYEIVDPYEIIIINDDLNLDPIMRWVEVKYPNIKILFCENNGEFKKSYCFNSAVLHTSSDILCFYDVDVLLPLDQLLHAEKLILNNLFDHVYPFSGVFVDVKRIFFDKFLPKFDFEILQAEVIDDTLGFFNGNINVISDNSPGGCNLISKKAFNRIGGYDDRFVGWGFEDTDFRERSKKENSVKYLGGKCPIFHLEHTTHCDQDRSKQPHYFNNFKVYTTNKIKR